jgi:hypothetical protein
VRRVIALLAGITAAVAVLRCGGSPIAPPPPPPPPPPANNLPVIDSITIQGTRPNEPASFADAGETVNITARIHDDETAVDQLQLQWSAPVGTFSGSGTAVTWTAPASVSAPADVTISLKVTEKYGTALAFSHSVDGSATLSLHDSIKEVGEMARQFLLDFSDSSIPVSQVMRNFDPACPGTNEETSQVTGNRHTFQIVKWDIGQPTVRVPFGNAFCPVPGRTQLGDACSSTPSHWESKFLSNGNYQIADGVDYISAYYRPALKAWKLCDSQFVGTCTDIDNGKKCSDEQMKSMVPGGWRRSDPPAHRPPSE